MPGISATITVDTPILTIGATSTVEIAFNEAATGFDATDLILPGGSISNLISADGGINWTATYTPQAGIQSATNVIGLNLSSVMDSGGTAGVNLEVDSNNFLVDGVAPFINGITVQNASLHAGESTPVTFHFSEFVNGFAVNQITAPGGVISNLTTANNITWTATYTPNDNTQSSGLIISASPNVTDFAGNAGGGSATSNSFDIDTVRPQGQIALTDAGALDPTHPGHVTISFNEAVTGVAAGALSGDGTFSNIQAVDASHYTATFTPNAGVQSNSETISLDLSQVTATSDGNAGEGTATSSAFGIDTQGPTSTVTVGSGGVIGAGGAPVTIVFSEPTVGFTAGLVTAQDGTVTQLATNDQQTFTGVFTPNAGVSASGDHLTVDNTGVADAVGNAGTGTGSGAYNVDTLAPTLQSAVVTDTAPLAGEDDRVNVTFSEAVTGFSLADVTAQNATASNLVNDGGGAYHFTLTPADNLVANGNTVSITSDGVSDLAGNAATGSVTSNAYDLDTIRPTATLQMTDTLIAGGGTSPFAINFSEAVSGFDNSDLTVSGGTLSTVATVDNIHYTATFTPNANTFQTGDTVTLDNTGVTSVATGNTGAGTTASNSFNVETQAPTVAQIQTPAAVGIGQGSFNVVFSEPVATFPLSALGGDAQGAFLAPGTSGNHTVWNIRFNPNASTNQTGATFTVDMSQVVDLAGNHGAGTTSSSPFNIDDVAPTAVSLNVGATTLHAGDTSPVTLTFSEPVQGVTLAGFGAGTNNAGTVSNLQTTDGGTTWTGTLTPQAGVLQANEDITFNVNSVTDLAGNQGAQGIVASNPYTELTLVPTATISLSDDHVGTNGQLTVTVNVNDIHVVPTFTLSAQDADITGLQQTGSTTYQATLTPHNGVVDLHDTVTLTGLDNTFNVNPSTFTSSQFALATTTPTGVVNLATTPLHAGQTAQVDFHFSEAVETLPAGAITALHGAVSDLQSTNGGLDWLATFTPAANDAADIAGVSLDLSQVTDFGGNPGGGAISSSGVPIDTLSPTATIALDHTTLTGVQTAGVTFTFSEPVSGFTNADLNVLDGTLSAVSSADGGRTWTSTFTPAANVFDDGDHIALDNTGVSDLAGNPGVGTTISTAYNVETGSPPSAPSPPAPPAQPAPSDGPETLTATQGDNTITGGVGSDMVIGSASDDSMSGQGGADTLSGGDGADFLQGNVGADSVNGGNGDDKVYGGQGDDIVQGGMGNDFVSGDKGDDVVRGGQGDDVVSGGDGNDFLSGDKGDDTLTGGAGADTFHSFAGAGLDVVTDFNLAEGDRVELDPGTTFTTAQVGADTVITLSGAGGSGEVVLQGVQLSSLHGDWIFVG